MSTSCVRTTTAAERAHGIHVVSSTAYHRKHGIDYDMTPSISNSFPQSAPGQLAAIAYLFGLAPPDVPSARLLEISCAAGGNLSSYAAAHPQARVVGIDLSQVQIDQGRARTRALGLDNVDLIAGDIARMDPVGLGQFDFVIAHGVHSWVPAECRKRSCRPFAGC